MSVLILDTEQCILPNPLITDFHINEGRFVIFINGEYEGHALVAATQGSQFMIRPDPVEPITETAIKYLYDEYKIGSYICTIPFLRDGRPTEAYMYWGIQLVPETVVYHFPYKIRDYFDFEGF